MKTYCMTKKWHAHQMTCSELINLLEQNGGFPGCLGELEFIESPGDEPVLISRSWDWIQSNRGNKKLWVLSPFNSEWVFSQ